MAWSLVLITSNGLTANAAVEPATHPDANEHQNTAVNHWLNWLKLTQTLYLNSSSIF